MKLPNYIVYITVKNSSTAASYNIKKLLHMLMQ